MKFYHDYPRDFDTKVSVNELRFPLVTHTVYSNARFESYRTLKSGQGAEDSLNRLDRPEHDQVLRAEDV
jgi:hypothetical protein